MNLKAVAFLFSSMTLGLGALVVAEVIPDARCVEDICTGMVVGTNECDAPNDPCVDSSCTRCLSDVTRQFCRLGYPDEECVVKEVGFNECGDKVEYACIIDDGCECPEGNAAEGEVVGECQLKKCTDPI